MRIAFRDCIAARVAWTAALFGGLSCCAFNGFRSTTQLPAAAATARVSAAATSRDGISHRAGPIACRHGRSSAAAR